VLFVVLVIYSGFAMISVAKAHKTNVPTWFFNIVEIFDYVELSKIKNGRVGVWFWVFVASLIALVTTVMLDRLVL